MDQVLQILLTYALLQCLSHHFDEQTTKFQVYHIAFTRMSELQEATLNGSSSTLSTSLLKEDGHGKEGIFSVLQKDTGTEMN